MRSISIITVTYNSEETLTRYLESIAQQDYDKDSVEILVVDGGSTDKTVEIAESSGARIIHETTGSPESAKAIGLQSAKNEIIAFISSDNIASHKDWLKMMVKPLDEDDEIVATQPLRYTYRRDDTLLNRYFALFGVNDPVPYYLNKRDRLSWMEDSWNLVGEAQDKGPYYKVKFKASSMPTLGDNGFFVRKDILKKARVTPEEYFHIDVNYDLISQGFDTYGIVKTDIVHATGERFLNFFRKRRRYMKELYLRDTQRRRYKMYTPDDRWKLAKYVLYSMTFIEPLYQSFKGYRAVHDRAWFLHPIMCFLMTITYGFTVLEWKIGSIFKRNSSGR